MMYVSIIKGCLIKLNFQNLLPTPQLKKLSPASYHLIFNDLSVSDNCVQC